MTATAIIHNTSNTAATTITKTGITHHTPRITTKTIRNNTPMASTDIPVDGMVVMYRNQ